MIRRPPRSTLFPYTTPLPISPPHVRPFDERDPVGREVVVEDSELVVVCGWQAIEVDVSDFDATGIDVPDREGRDRKSTRLNSSHANISYAVFCLQKKKTPSTT